MLEVPPPPVKAEMTNMSPFLWRPENDPSAFGFLDPSLVLRGCHLIPAFNDGRTSDLLTAPLTIARPPDEVDDWVAFYVNMHVAFLSGIIILLLITNYTIIA